MMSLVPTQLRIEDGYEIDVDDYIGRRTPRALVDRDRIMSYELFGSRKEGWMASFAYDIERHGPLAPTGDVFRFVADYRF